MALDPHEILFFLPILDPPLPIFRPPNFNLWPLIYYFLVLGPNNLDLLGLDIIPPSMDTSNYDQKVAELRAAASQGQLARSEVERITKVGRPKGPERVVYKRNISPSMVKRMDEFLKRSTSDDPLPDTHDIPKALIKDDHSQVEELKSQIKALLADNDRLSKEVATVEHRLSRVARLTDNEKLILWIRKYDELKKVYDLRLGGSEFSQ